MSEEPIQPQVMRLPDGRTARVTDVTDGVVNVDIDEAPSDRDSRSLFALVVMLAGTIGLSVGVAGMAGVYAGLAVGGAVVLIVGFLLALTT